MRESVVDCFSFSPLTCDNTISHEGTAKNIHRKFRPLARERGKIAEIEKNTHRKFRPLARERGKIAEIEKTLTANLGRSLASEVK